MVQATLQATGAPARRTFVARLVPPEQLTAAIALNTLTGRITMLFGPALAGVITGAFGLRTCYAIYAPVTILGTAGSAGPGGGHGAGGRRPS
jgi:MFS-type transporter involved in bile tolerance (Atg22 family)